VLVRPAAAMMELEVMKNKICLWFGHTAESQGVDRTSDFPSENFVCSRCEHQYSVNEWGGPQPKPKIFVYGFRLLIAGAIVWLWLQVA